jgi:hypothetical protein
VRDLDHIIQIVDRLIDYLLTDFDNAQKILEKFLELCALVSSMRFHHHGI